MVRDQYANVTGFKMRNDVFDIGWRSGRRLQRFIEENHSGLSGERTRDFDPPTFSARQRLTRESAKWPTLNSSSSDSVKVWRSLASVRACLKNRQQVISTESCRNTDASCGR